MTLAKARLLQEHSQLLIRPRPSLRDEPCDHCASVDWATDLQINTSVWIYSSLSMSIADRHPTYWRSQRLTGTRPSCDNGACVRWASISSANTSGRPAKTCLQIRSSINNELYSTYIDSCHCQCIITEWHQGTSVSASLVSRMVTVHYYIWCAKIVDINDAMLCWICCSIFVLRLLHWLLGLTGYCCCHVPINRTGLGCVEPLHGTCHLGCIGPQTNSRTSN
jgi:hypothetical protein